jgi:hypothetical protein
LLRKIRSVNQAAAACVGFSMLATGRLDESENYSHFILDGNFRPDPFGGRKPLGHIPPMINQP